MTFMNKPPEWKECKIKSQKINLNLELQAYVLNFNGRVEKASVKNFQLIDKNECKQQLLTKNISLADSILMQFGRVTKHEFSMDVSYPLSLF